jgi:hypothetical protein
MRFALKNQVRFSTGQTFWGWFGDKQIGRWELREHRVRSGLPGREPLLQKAFCLQTNLS